MSDFLALGLQDVKENLTAVSHSSNHVTKSLWPLPTGARRHQHPITFMFYFRRQENHQGGGSPVPHFAVFGLTLDEVLPRNGRVLFSAPHLGSWQDPVLLGRYPPQALAKADGFGGYT